SIAGQQLVDGGFAFDEAKGSVVWRDANTLFAAIADTPAASTASGYPRIVRRVSRGQPLGDAPIIFEASERDIGVWPISIIRNGQRHSFLTRALTFFESEHYRLYADEKPVRLPLPLKSEIEGILGDLLIVTLREDWRHGGKSFAAGDLIALDLKSKKAALVFHPGPHQALSGVAVSQSAIILELLDNVIARIVRLTRRGAAWHAVDIGLPGEGVAALGSVNATGDDFFLTFESPILPPALFYVAQGGSRRAVRQSPARFDARGIVMEQRHAKSSDGTRIPYFLIGREGAIRQGKAPTILYGYGGFEVPSTPSYSGVTGRLWLEQGGLYAIANIRGGGEFGPRWHQAALKSKRQHAFDDFFAVAEDLIQSGATTPKRLGAYGGSNGGLLMGVALTQRPDLFNALAIGVPLLDMLRYTELLAGASWVGEYGDPAIPAERAVLARYSPYHQLKPNRAYPRPFLFTSTRDDRVHPGHARKMAAKLKELGYDFLYYENIEGGHGAAANQNQAAYRAALQYIYFTRQLMDDSGSKAKGSP
ncbi:MAG: prolyl oligopeptidase family serine peptidase, partial [Parvularculaceae bacterium]